MLSTNTNIEKKLRDLGSHGIYIKMFVSYPVASGVIGRENYFLPNQMKTQ